MHSLICRVQRKLVACFKWFKGSHVVCNTWLLMEFHLWKVRWYCWWYQAFSQCVELEGPAHDWNTDEKPSGQYVYFCLTAFCFTSSKGLTEQHRVNFWPEYFWENWQLWQSRRLSLDECRARDGRCKDWSWTQAGGFPQRAKPLQ